MIDDDRGDAVVLSTGESIRIRAIADDHRNAGG